MTEIEQAKRECKLAEENWRKSVRRLNELREEVKQMEALHEQAQRRVGEAIQREINRLAAIKERDSQ